MLRQLLKSAIILLALFVLPIQAMAMFSGMNGMYIEFNNNDVDLTDDVMFVVNEKDVSIVLNPAEAVLMVGKTLQIEATVLPENVNHVKLVWDSRNKKVATVNESGLVTAVGPGESVITASLQTVVDGVISTLSAECKIRVERPVESIVLNPTNAVLEVGDNLPIMATVLPEDATNKTLQWTSNNTAVASVDDNGVVMALAPGDCMIIASCGDVEATCQIKVNNPVILADSIVVVGEKNEIEIGEVLNLQAIVYPENTSDTRLTWESSDNSIATVVEYGHNLGIVTGVAPGTCDIYAICGEVRTRGTYQITVKNPVVFAESVVLDPVEAELQIGSSITIAATVLPENVTNPLLKWFSSDETVAIVNKNGVVTAVGPGSCDITATCDNAVGTCHVTVQEPIIYAESVELFPSEAVLQVDETIGIKATILPENMPYPRLDWRSSDESVATVSKKGFVTAVGPGSCDITATCDNAVGTCHVTVLPPAISADSVALDPTSAELEVGASITIAATVLPENVTNPELVWQSSDESIATVSQDGVVTAVSAGQCEITASCDEVSANCHILVYDPADVVISLDCDEVKVVLKQEVELVPIVSLPIRTELTVASSDTTVVTAKMVNGTVILSGVGFGKATISVSSLNGMAQPDSCEVVVSTLYGDVNHDGLVTIMDVSKITEYLMAERSASDDTYYYDVEPDGRITVADLSVLIDMLLSGDDPEFVIVPESISLNTDDVNLDLGGSMVLEALILPEDVTNKFTSWVSTNGNVAKVREGVVNAIGVGECDIIAACKDKLTVCHVEVNEILPEYVSLNQNIVSLFLGEQITLNANVYPENTTDKTVVWTSTNTSVATVANGKVTAKGVGNCLIIADCQGKRDTCSVTVSAIVPESVVLSQHSASMLPGEQLTLTATVYPENTTDKTVVWSSSDSKVATVVDGKVTAKDIGNCLIIVDCQGMRDTCSVIVSAIVPESVVLSQHSASMLPGEQITLTATVYPDNTTDKTVVWSSTDSKVATVAGGKVTAKDMGNCFIIADCQGKRDTCSVTVTAVSPEKVLLSQHSASMLPGEQITLTATVYPDNVTDKTVVWSSTNSSVATVVNGKVTAKAVGNCFIIADCQGKRDTCSVNVYVVAPEKVVMSQHSASLLPGEQITLTATVYPDDVTDKTVVWSSTNSSVATVVNGKVTAKAVGNCFIIADCQGKCDTCAVTVYVVTPESLVLNQSAVTLGVGEQTTLRATVYPQNATNSTVTWRSTATSVATVNNGVVKAIGVGECDIIATCQNLQATCHVTVKNEDENTFTVNGVSFNMVSVEGGTFYMGAPATQLGSGTNERPQHYVTLSSFKIGQTEVTQELWVAVMGHNPSAFQGNPQRPVDNVSWEMCKEFLDSLNALTGKNFRFPTEAEWEFAARGGNLSEGYLFSGGNQPVGDVAWYTTNSGSMSHPVAQKKPNELGLYDMSGNVAEWCSDWYMQYPSDPQTNPTGPATGTFKMYRGGSWDDKAAWCRPPYRAMQSTTYRREFLGLRLVL